VSAPLSIPDFSKTATELGPWWFRFEADGLTFGGSVERETVKTEWFFDCIAKLGGDPIRTVLELGAHEGSHSLQLAARSSIERVVALEGLKANLARALFVKRVFRDEKIAFREYDIERLDPADFAEPFDAVFCAGLLYHLPKPWQLIRALRHLTRKYLFLDTHYAATADATAEGYAGWWFAEGQSPLSGLSPSSFWFSFKDLTIALMENGFLIRFIHDMKDFPRGPRAFILAELAKGAGATRGTPVVPVGKDEQK
jgi:methyltransferase family protein